MPMVDHAVDQTKMSEFGNNPSIQPLVRRVEIREWPQMVQWLLLPGVQ